MDAGTQIPCGNDNKLGEPDGVAYLEGAGFADAGVDADAAFVVLREVAQQCGIGGGGFGVERDDPAAWNALKDSELWTVAVARVSKPERFAEELVFGEGLGAVQGKNQIGAEAQRSYRAAAFVREGLERGLRDE